MTVYVDDAKIVKGKMRVSHMFANTEQQLHRMARVAKVRKHHFKKRGTAQAHYRVTEAMRDRAIAAGAVPVSMTDAAYMVYYRQEHKTLPPPPSATSDKTY